VMSYVEGTVLDSPSKGEQLPVHLRQAASHHLIDVLADLHSLDVDDIGLGDLAKRAGYIERQVKRWSTQWENSKTRDLSAIDEVADILAKNIPTQQGVVVAHGDFRFGNCLTDITTGRIVAVLDWELCTLGDPLADLGLLMVYWTGPNDDTNVRPFSGTQAPGFLDRKDIATRYAAASGRDISQLDFYVAFAYWKLACIMEGVFARYQAGAMGATDAESLRLFSEQVEMSARQARETLARLG